MNIEELFIELAKIPSPSLREDNVIKYIKSYCADLGLSTKQDDYGNIYLKLEATDKTKKPLILSAHMDVVGGDEEVNIVKEGDIIKTDGTRTLGADNKAGIASILKLFEVVKNSNTSHGTLEALFTRDEEVGMTGINHANFDEFEGEYVLVLDSDSLGNIEFAGADYTKMLLEVETLKGGHSGNDIWDKSRLNAINVIAEAICTLPSGVWASDEAGTITSLNAGAIIGGAIEKVVPNADKNFTKELIQEARDNIINTYACAKYSIRSSSSEHKRTLIEKIEATVAELNKKYEGLAVFKIDIKNHMPMFEKADDETMINIARAAAEKINLPYKVQTFHAGAETHIWANKTNRLGNKFKPLLLGGADIKNMHSSKETLDVKSLEKGSEWVQEIFWELNK